MQEPDLLNISHAVQISNLDCLVKDSCSYASFQSVPKTLMFHTLSEPVPSSFFFLYFCEFMPVGKSLKMKGPNDFVEKLPLWIFVERSTQYFCDIIWSFGDTSCTYGMMFDRILQLVHFFKLDEEVFLLSLIIFHRYFRTTKEILRLLLSQLLYLLVLCIMLAFKSMYDIPVNIRSIAQALNLRLNAIHTNEIQILNTLGYDLFYTYSDLEGLENVFPLEAMMYLSFASRTAALSPIDLDDGLLEQSQEINPLYSTSPSPTDCGSLETNRLSTSPHSFPLSLHEVSPDAASLNDSMLFEVENDGRAEEIYVENEGGKNMSNVSEGREKEKEKSGMRRCECDVGKIEGEDNHTPSVVQGYRDFLRWCEDKGGVVVSENNMAQLVLAFFEEIKGFKKNLRND